MVVNSGQVEVVEDADYVVFFFRGFVGCYDWFGGGVFFFLGLLVGLRSWTGARTYLLRETSGQEGKSRCLLVIVLLVLLSFAFVFLFILLLLDS